MGIVYEHWRPDTNVCFYVGASRIGESRANDFTSRNKNHGEIVLFLKNSGQEPQAKIVWDNLPDDVVGIYEKMRISYQKALVGKSLTNIGKGGFGFEISLEYNREIQKIIQNTPEVNFKRSQSLKRTNKKPETIEKRSLAAKLAHQRPETIKRHKESEQSPELRAKRIASASLGGKAAALRTPQEKRESGLKSVQTRIKNQTSKILRKKDD
jgi:hypothetical protein